MSSAVMPQHRSDPRLPARPRPRRRLATAALLLATAPLFAGCGTPQVSMVEGSPFGQVSAAGMHVGDPVLVRSADGSEAALVATLVNDGPGADALTAVTAEPLAPPTAPTSPVPQLRADIAGGQLAVPVSVMGDVQTLGGPDNPRQVVFRDQGNAALRPGVFARLTFLFRQAGALTTTVLVAPAGEYLATYAPTAPPAGASPSPAPGAGAAATSSPAPTFSETPGSVPYPPRY